MATADRHLLILHWVPREPRSITCSELRDRLRDAGHEVTLRTLQRDLLDLSTRYPLCTDGASKPQRWRYIRDAPVLNIPGMDPTAAFALRMAEVHLVAALPPALLPALEPYFKAARRVLNEAPGASVLRELASRVRSIQPGQPLIPPAVAPGVLEVVQRGLSERRQIQVRYRALGREPTQQRLHPVAMVERQGVIYLIACAWEYAAPWHFALHRMADPELLDLPSREPEGFELDHYLKSSRAFLYPTGRVLRLRLALSPGIAQHLSECRLSEDQQLSPPKADGRWRLRASVAETEQLLWWLQSFGDKVEVLGPRPLRLQMARILGAAAARYGEPSEP